MKSSLELQTPASSTAVTHPNRRRLNLSLAALGASFLVATEARLAGAQTTAIIDVVAVAQGYRFSDLKGHKVLNNTGNSIGTLDDLIITKDKSLYAILAVGGFLGIGAHLVAVPYDSLSISPDGKTITVANASKSQLEQMPEFKYAPAPTGNMSGSGASSGGSNATTKSK